MKHGKGRNAVGFIPDNSTGAIIARSGALAPLVFGLPFAQVPGLPVQGWPTLAIATTLFWVVICPVLAGMIVVGGSLATGGLGPIPATVVGALLLGLVFNTLSFKNGRVAISISTFWQTVTRGTVLFAVILFQPRVVARNQKEANT